jgi:hypothetical protein
MSQVIDWWGDLPPPMKEAIEQFRTQLGAAIDYVEFVKGHSYTKLTTGKALPGAELDDRKRLNTGRSLPRTTPRVSSPA